MYSETERLQAANSVRSAVLMCDAKTTRNETLRSPGRQSPRSVYLLIVFFVVCQVMMLILKTVFHPNGELSAKRIIICLSFTKEYLYQASSLTKSFRLTAAEVSSTPFSTALLASYWSSSLFFLKDGGASRCNLLISDICSAALESLDLFKSETDADTRPLIWERSWGVITRLRLTE